ncbi:hypothetical protein GCM10010124_37900 [Pilimelia terevasa]|uniref:Uncharacterized protein n=1 Tax=Pilimelia terevasa TaxID=53372 RepID=A0A8J3BTX1_9ACTN|nr:hypothetical protein [Pilimelia terevasa]GGK41450.1 hypothetical protein GCM10010124_37900 [Pilimelia terevasa]
MTGMFDAGGTRDAGAELTPAQRDLLADYVGGALADTPVEADVAQWVAADPAWRRAHDALVVASSAVSADLRSWAQAPVPMPDDVAARLATVLRIEGIGPAPIDLAPGTPATAVPTVAAAGAHRSPPRRWLPRFALAAGVLAVAGIGVTVASDLGGTPPEDTRTTAGTPLSTTTAETFNRSGETMPPVRVSGVAYEGGTLGTAAGVTLDSTAADLTRAPAGLGRLTGAAALTACLEALRSAQPEIARITLVDYATFERTPALVVLSDNRGGGRSVTAVGADCGRVAGAQVLRRVAAR